jgi:acetoin utilization deacetylase AcuC-like enzyme
MQKLRELAENDFILIDEGITIQEGVAQLLKEKKNVLVYKHMGQFYFVDQASFLQAIKKGMDIRLGKITALGEKAVTFSADTPLFKVVERMEDKGKKTPELILITQAENVVGTLPLSKIRTEEILRARIARDIYRKMEDSKLLAKEADKEPEEETPDKAKWTDFATELRGMLKVATDPFSETEAVKKASKVKIGILYNSIHILHKSQEKSPENPERILRIMSLLEGRAGVFKEDVELITKFSPISENELLLAHDKNYIDFIKGYCEKGGGFLGDSTYLNYNTLTAASFAVGAAIKAANLVLKNEYDLAWSLMRPPGHHAGANKYGGFCLFNTAAITARYLQQRKGLRKILILDWDGHAANGTQSIFYADGSVLLISLHQDPKDAYPHSGFIPEIGIEDGRGRNINIVLPTNAGDKEYKKALETIVVPVVQNFEPDFVIGCNGFDAHFADSHTNLNMSSDGYYDIGRYFRQNFLNKSIIITEGGYHEYNGLLVVAVLDALRGRELTMKEKTKPRSLDNIKKRKLKEGSKKNLKALKDNLGEYYPELLD